MSQWTPDEKTELVRLVCDARLESGSVDWARLQARYPGRTVLQVQQTYQNMTRKDSLGRTCRVWKAKHLLAVQGACVGGPIDWLRLRQSLPAFAMQDIIAKVRQVRREGSDPGELGPPQELLRLLRHVLE
ncbi:hypothetical protein SS50377_24191 [Spironucleus salmonicida]|nr:hypothetical protein SS50377_24177 [Spironucleus salmonicida]KAH0574240.1 hypothetical protein SS50377_24191 [Spironucleus salmonicida]